MNHLNVFPSRERVKHVLIIMIIDITSSWWSRVPRRLSTCLVSFFSRKPESSMLSQPVSGGRKEAKKKDRLSLRLTFVFFFLPVLCKLFQSVMNTKWWILTEAASLFYISLFFCRTMPCRHLHTSIFPISRDKRNEYIWMKCYTHSSSLFLQANFFFRSRALSLFSQKLFNIDNTIFFFLFFCSQVEIHMRLSNFGSIMRQPLPSLPWTKGVALEK